MEVLLGLNAYPRPTSIPRDPSGRYLVPLEILHGALVLFGRSARFERSKIAALARLGIGFPGIEPVFAGSQFTDHDSGLLCADNCKFVVAFPCVDSFTGSLTPSQGALVADDVGNTVWRVTSAGG